ncbi:MAG: glycoside hydrolase [Proteobacteria bacterium]|nr:glycoside hydrolase [Burkholderiales bacterium]
MHQPDYRDAGTGEFLLPWVYLHALKDYSDMAAHLERHPGMRVVVNFVPVLTRQIDDYVEQFASGVFRDPLLRALAVEEPGALSRYDRAQVLDLCFRANPRTMIEPFAGFTRLADIHRRCTADGSDLTDYLSGEYLTDLATWYHLAWTSETLRREQVLLRRLIAQGAQYTHAQRVELLALIGVEITRVIGRWRDLAARGQVELSTTPDCHPLAPLMVDFVSARDAVPNSELPVAACYPGGSGRVEAHIERAFDEHKARFGVPPAGVWPAEGAVSEAVLAILAARGSQWSASGEAVLMHSLPLARETKPGERARRLYRPYTLVDGPLPSAGTPPARAGSQAEAAPTGMRLFFRDDRLSDLIGFDYSKRHSGEAAAQFVAELEAIAADWEEPTPPVVSVMLDGENAWEHFPYNGYYFLDELYRRLAAHPVINTTTFAELIARDVPTAALARLSAGSWVYGDLATWVGAPEKNRAWDLLVAAKQAFDRVVDTLAPAAREEALRRLAVCEGSDWFWWFGDYNPEQTIASFDSLFRLHLTRLYECLGIAVPAVLSDRIHASAEGGDAEGGGSMRRSAPGPG